MPIDDKPIVLVGDKSVEVKPLSAERKDIAACFPVCVDKGVQTNAIWADHVSMHMATRVEDRCFVRTPMRHFIGAVMRMHKGNDGRVRQLCSPGIAPILKGRRKKVHVQQQMAPSRVEKKMVVVPKSKLILRRNMVPNAMLSQASQEGGGGVVGWLELKMSTRRDVVIDITSPFRVDPPALRITLFEGGGDVKDPMKGKVKPNFRTPPTS
jgi:hypothetical protein